MTAERTALIDPATGESDEHLIATGDDPAGARAAVQAWATALAWSGERAVALHPGEEWTRLAAAIGGRALTLGPGGDRGHDPLTEHGYRLESRADWLAWLDEAAESEGLLGSVDDPEAMRSYAAHVHERPGSLPADDVERRLDLELARLAALVAVRRHARPGQPTESPRPLANVTTLVGSGGVLRHTDRAGRAHVLDAVLADHAGGWKVPRSATATVDAAYLLYAVGLLDAHDPALARSVASQLG